MKTVCKVCPECDKKNYIEISDEQYQRYTEGSELIQKIFPEMNPIQREILVTGICGDCWNKLFPIDKDEDEE